MLLDENFRDSTCFLVCAFLCKWLLGDNKGTYKPLEYLAQYQYILERMQKYLR